METSTEFDPFAFPFTNPNPKLELKFFKLDQTLEPPKNKSMEIFFSP